jgi:hypothetical protein
VPTDIRRAIATKLQLEKEAKFAETGILLCFALCLLNLLLIFESPALLLRLYARRVNQLAQSLQYVATCKVHIFGFSVKNNHANLVIDH